MMSRGAISSAFAEPALGIGQIPLCLSSWSLHSEFLNEDLRADQFPGVAKDYFGVDCIEFFEGDFSPSFAKEDVHRKAEKIRKACDLAGVRLVAVAAVNDLTDVKWQHDLDRLQKWLSLAPILGFQCLRINSGRKKLTLEHVEPFVEILKPLAESAGKRGVTLVLENHPHVLRGLQDLHSFVAVLTRVNHPHLRACPDLGAFGPGFWQVGFRTLVPFARHIHIKPAVYDFGTKNERVDTSVSNYLKVVRQELLDRKEPYMGVLSFEYAEFLAMDEDVRGKVRDQLRIAAHVMQWPLHPVHEPASPLITVPARVKNELPDISPDTGLLGTLADGCQERINGAQIRIHDFGTGEEVYSSKARHQHGPHDGARDVRGRVPISLLPSPDRHRYCQIVDEIPKLKEACGEFHGALIQRVSDGKWSKARLSVCPMGLTVLTVPIQDGENLFGSITCGPWIEEGTEGMVTDAVGAAPIDRRHDLEVEGLATESFEIETLRRAENILSGLAKSLSTIYRERLAAIQHLDTGLSEITHLRIYVDRLSSAKDLDVFDGERVAKEFQSLLGKFMRIIRLGSILLYCEKPASGESGARLVRVAVVPDAIASMPESVLIPDGVDHENPAFAKRELLKEELERQDLAPVASTIFAGRFFAFHVRRKTQPPLAKNDEILLKQMLAEVEYSAEHLLGLAESIRIEKGLRFFISRLKHAIAGSLTRVDTDIRHLANWLEAATTTPDGIEDRLRLLRSIHDSLRMGSNEAGAILKRLVGNVRLVGSEGFRPPISRTRFDFQNCVKACIRKFHVAARNQSVLVRAEISDFVNWMFVGDEAAIGEVVENLIDNALKFARSGTHVKVALYHHDRLQKNMPLIHWSLSRPGIRLLVENIGPRISPEEQEKIFAPFIQGSNEPPEGRTNKGTGIGLAICKDVVELHKGRIFVRCIPIASSQDFIVQFCTDLPILPEPKEVA